MSCRRSALRVWPHCHTGQKHKEFHFFMLKALPRNKRAAQTPAKHSVTPTHNKLVKNRVFPWLQITPRPSSTRQGGCGFVFLRREFLSVGSCAPVMHSVCRVGHSKQCIYCGALGDGGRWPCAWGREIDGASSCVCVWGWHVAVTNCRWLLWFRAAGKRDGCAWAWRWVPVCARQIGY